MRNFKIKNWTLAFVTLIFFCFLTSLGVWQLKRATQKKELLKAFHARTMKTPLTSINPIHASKDLRFYRATLSGHFDQNHIFLLDNKIFHGQVGYEIYVPFKLSESNAAILVDRGFVPVGRRDQLPVISKVDTNNVTGMLNLPPTYFSFGKMLDQEKNDWPHRIEFVNLQNIEKMIGYSLSPYILSLTPNHPAALPIEWQIVIMQPERHLGYAFQWFALAFTLLILFVALGISTK